MATAKANPLTTRDFSRVVLTLDNVLIPYEKLSPTPSLVDGLDLDTETDLRILGCELIQIAGILLKIPQVGRHIGFSFPEFQIILIVDLDMVISKLYF